MDFAPHHKPDFAADVLNLPIAEGAIGEILAQDVLEHLPRTSTTEALAEWRRVTEADEVARIRVPSLFHAVDLKRSADTLSMHQILVQNLYGTQAYTGDVHLTSFTDRTIADAFHSAVIVESRASSSITGCGTSRHGPVRDYRWPFSGELGSTHAKVPAHPSTINSGRPPGGGHAERVEIAFHARLDRLDVGDPRELFFRADDSVLRVEADSLLQEPLFHRAPAEEPAETKTLANESAFPPRRRLRTAASAVRAFSRRAAARATDRLDGRSQDAERRVTGHRPSRLK